LGRTVHFPGNGKGKESCCGVDFMTFLKFFLKCREGNPYRKAASNALTSNYNANEINVVSYIFSPSYFLNLLLDFEK
jgi:hypothetical protein